jgi:hypothetical protein
MRPILTIALIVGTLLAVGCGQSSESEQSGGSSQSGGSDQASDTKRGTTSSPEAQYGGALDGEGYPRPSATGTAVQMGEGFPVTMEDGTARMTVTKVETVDTLETIGEPVEGQNGPYTVVYYKLKNTGQTYIHDDFFIESRTDKTTYTFTTDLNSFAIFDNPNLYRSGTDVAPGATIKYAEILDHTKGETVQEVAILEGFSRNVYAIVEVN